jgi:hypothetical protein
MANTSPIEWTDAFIQEPVRGCGGWIEAQHARKTALASLPRPW